MSKNCDDLNPTEFYRKDVNASEIATIPKHSRALKLTSVPATKELSSKSTITELVEENEFQKIKADEKRVEVSDGESESIEKWNEDSVKNIEMEGAEECENASQELYEDQLIPLTCSQAAKSTSVLAMKELASKSGITELVEENELQKTKADEKRFEVSDGESESIERLNEDSVTNIKMEEVTQEKTEECENASQELNEDQLIPLTCELLKVIIDLLQIQRAQILLEECLQLLQERRESVSRLNDQRQGG